MNLETQRQLVERARTDPEAFGQLFDMYYKKILVYTIRRVGSVATAEDLVAETFVKALRGLPKFTWRGVSIEAWLYAIAGNEIRMHYRANRRLTSLDELYEQDGFELQDDYDLAKEAEEAQDKLQRHKDFVKVQQLIKLLPEKYQEVLVLRFAENKKISEISQIVGKREGTVKSLLSRGLGKLRQELQALAVQPSPAKRIVYNEGRELSKPQEEL